MKKCISASSALLMAAAVMFVGCGDAGGGDTGSVALEQTQTTAGTCNAVVARTLRFAQECYRSEACEPGAGVCVEATANFVEFFSDPECVGALLGSEHNGLPAGNASQHRDDCPKESALNRNREEICIAISDCGLSGGFP